MVRESMFPAIGRRTSSGDGDSMSSSSNTARGKIEMEAVGYEGTGCAIRVESAGGPEVNHVILKTQELTSSLFLFCLLKVPRGWCRRFDHGMYEITTTGTRQQ